VDGSFRLADAYGLDDHGIKPCCLAKENGFPGLSGDPSQGVARGGGAYERLRGIGERGHAGFVSQDTAFAELAAGVYGQNGYLAAGFDQIFSKSINERAFPGSGGSGDADARGLAALGQTVFDQAVCLFDMFGEGAFYQGNSLAQGYAVAFQ
jgi:hypothetical protein